MATIQEQMAKELSDRIDRVIDRNETEIYIDRESAKRAAKILADLSLDKGSIEGLSERYIESIKDILHYYR
ncbi:MAG: hypothetical protein IAC51_07225 [bacterium]|uniref:Uncharacterized protein n=1 Tax=Candidatus Aphodosoma intestinipullorum TaxID=2840674 RepID=A0A940DND9_9BACT|nr:hypothetical protein [Candidatus Aphodosoma intestinipullorum]